MEENKELKTRSFRISDETIERFKAISGDIGGNQQATLAKLIDLYDLEKGKMLNPGAAENLTQFDAFCNGLARLYLKAIEDNTNMKELCYSSFEGQLLSKDKLIVDFQIKVEALTKQLSNNDNIVSSINMEKDNLVSELDALRVTSADKQLQSDLMLKDKQDLIENLLANIEEYKVRVDGEKCTRDENLRLEKAVIEYERKLVKYGSIESDLEKSKIEISQLKENMNIELAKVIENQTVSISSVKEKCELASQKSLLEMKSEFQVKLKTVEDLHNEEIKNYQQKYLSLLERLENHSS